jgi:methoxymalonate biosynthesis acyl carrier protein
VPVQARDARTEIREYVTAALRRPALADDDDIFDVGGASSLFAAELVVFIEDRLGAELEDEDLVRENFATIDALTRLVERREAAT